jgi:hypothetical protein
MEESATAGQPLLKGICHLSARKAKNCGFSALSQLMLSAPATNEPTVTGSTMVSISPKVLP